MNYVFHASLLCVVALVPPTVPATLGLDFDFEFALTDPAGTVTRSKRLTLETEGVGVIFSDGFEAPTQDINYGLAGGWFNLLTSGQGFLFDFLPDTQFMSVAWFTFDTANTAKGGAIDGSEQRWFTAQGQYSGNRADLTVFHTRNGVFDDPTEPVTLAVGSMVVEFESCTQATITYDLPSFGLSGVIPVIKLLADEICSQIGRGRIRIRPGPEPGIAPSGSAQAINYGLIGGWSDPTTPGQLFMFDFLPETQFMFVLWFTFDTASSVKGGAIDGSEQRWFSAQGNYSGNSADLTIFQTRSGMFDDPTVPVTTAVGTMVVEFKSCTQGTITYDLPSFGLSGVIPVSKLLADEICSGPP